MNNVVSGGAHALHRLNQILAGLIVGLPLFWISDIPQWLGWLILVEQFIAFEYGLALTLVFLSIGADRSKKSKPTGIDCTLATGAMLLSIWIAIQFPDLIDELYVNRTEALVVGVPILGLTLEAVRRSLGWIMCGLVLVFFAYAIVNHLLPGPLGGVSIPFSTILLYSALSTESMYGRALTIVTIIVVPFIVFGQFFSAIGGGRFITEIASLAAGRGKGTPAKIAILSSALFGSISGSVVSNVMSTGTISIPLMRRAGFPRAISGGIEAVASTGGQLMPPVMGAAAFLMAEFVGVAYTDIILAALVPALLFYFVLVVQTDQIASRLDISGLERPSGPVRRGLARDAVMFTIPIAAVVATLLVWRRSPEAAALAGIIACVLIGLVRPQGDDRMGVREILSVLVRSGHASLDIVVVSAAAGLIIGIVALTGVGFGISLWMLKISGDQVFILLSVTALIAIVLGLGLATTTIYILLGTSLAPALVDAGIEPIAAHLFVLYAGMFCMITPPIAFAAFAAASLAESNFLETSVAAMRMGWCTYLLPFLFVFSPPLLLNGSFSEIMISLFFTVIGLWFVAGGVTGYLRTNRSMIERAALLISGGVLLYPASSDWWNVVFNISALAFGGFVAMRNSIENTHHPSIDL